MINYLKSSREYCFKILILPIILVIICFGVIYYLNFKYLDIINHIIYIMDNEDINKQLFVSFLTIGSFFLALQSYIISTLKSYIYDKEEYQIIIYKKSKEKNKPITNIFFKLESIIYAFLIIIIYILFMAFLNLLFVFMPENIIIYSIPFNIAALYYILLSIHIYYTILSDLTIVHQDVSNKIINKLKDTDNDDE